MSLNPNAVTGQSIKILIHLIFWLFPNTLLTPPPTGTRPRLLTEWNVLSQNYTHSLVLFLSLSGIMCTIATLYLFQYINKPNHPLSVVALSLLLMVLACELCTDDSCAIFTGFDMNLSTSNGQLNYPWTVYTQFIIAQQITHVNRTDNTINDIILETRRELLDDSKIMQQKFDTRDRFIKRTVQGGLASEHKV